jgi:signal transduction histidine kinase
MALRSGSREAGDTARLAQPAAGRSGRDGLVPERPSETERTRLAYAIHDGLTQVVTASVLELDWLARQAEVGPESAVQALHAAGDALRSALEEIRGVLAALTPPEPADVSQPVEELLRGVVDRWQLPVTWSIEGDLAAVPARILDAASAVIREGVANVAKHAESGDVEVRVQASRRMVVVSVEDHGRGFEASSVTASTGHMGLEMMARRVEEVHGTLDVESTPGTGTRVIARLPVSDQGVIQ